MGKSIVLYDLNERTAVQKTRIIRELFGYSDRSCNGRYKYKRDGLLSNIRYERKTKTAIIVSEKDGHKVVEILKKMGIRPIVASVRS